MLCNEGAHTCILTGELLGGRAACLLRWMLAWSPEARLSLSDSKSHTRDYTAPLTLILYAWWLSPCLVVRSPIRNTHRLVTHLDDHDADLLRSGGVAVALPPHPSRILGWLTALGFLQSLLRA